ncbi:MAG: type II toxin-antitoxin system RelE/ParE family toxin [Candidatus Binatia bacterium]
MQTVVETPAYLSDAKALGLTETERAAIVAWIAANPEAGDVIEGIGGARKVRFAGKGKGKSGGYRVLTFYSGADIPVFLLNVFAKNEKVDVTPKERATLKKILSDIARAYKARSKSR